MCGQSKIIAILKPGKNSRIPKNCRLIPLLCHTYKLHKILILNRISPIVEGHLIKEHTGFSSEMSYISQLFNLTQHIEDGYQRDMITEAAFVVVVVCLPRPMEGMGRLQFSDLFTELPVPPHVAGVVGTYMTTLISVFRFCRSVYSLRYSEPFNYHPEALQSNTGFHRVPTISAYRFQRNRPTGSNDLGIEVPTISAYTWWNC